MSIDQEIKQWKQAETTPEEEAFERLKEPGTLHIQNKVLENFALSPAQLPEIEQKVLRQHLLWCKECQEVCDVTLKEQDLELAS